METGEFPHLKPLFEAAIHGPRDFEQGLDWLLGGIEHEYGRK